MLFEEFERKEYKNNTLFEVIFQARFPQIIRISNEEPVKFQDAIRKKGFPEMTIKPNNPMVGMMTNMPNFITNLPMDRDYSFFSEDGNWKVVLAKDFIALSCNKYSSYQEFERKLNMTLSLFQQEYATDYFNRIGLRYNNLVNKNVYAGFKDIKKYIPCHIAPELSKNIGKEVSAFEKVIRFEDEFCKVNLKHVFATFSGRFGQYNLNDEEGYIIDIDCFSEEKVREVDDVITRSKVFNEKYARNAFNWSITEDLRVDMEPI